MTRTVKGCEIKPATRCVGARLQGKDLSGALLARSDLRRADLRRADLRGANLARADLRKAELQRADLRGANLNGTLLAGANLSFAKLAKATLRKADLDGAVLIGANLDGAELTAATLAKATTCLTVGPTGTLDNSGCASGTTGARPATTAPTAPPAAIPNAPLAVVRFDAPATYSCGPASGAERRQPGAGSTGMATIHWTVPDAAQAVFTLDGIRPSNVATNLPAIVDNPEGQSFGDVADGTVTNAFTSDRKPHVVDFVWSQANAAGVAIPGAPTVSRSATLTYVG